MRRTDRNAGGVCDRSGRRGASPAVTARGECSERRTVMKVVILGGTRGMGRELARQLAQRSDVRLFMLGRSPTDVAHSAADLSIRGKIGAVGHAVCDLADPTGFEAALRAADVALEGFDTVIVTAGLFATQERLAEDPELALRLLVVNHACTVVFCEHVRKYLLARGGGTLAVFSSVAGDRGRKPVAIYGSSKAGLSHYLESLDHTYREQGLVTLCVKPGFIKTTATADLKPPPFAGEPEQVARDLIRAIERGKPVLYTPRIWALVMWVIRLLPRSIMRKINF